MVAPLISLFLLLRASAMALLAAVLEAEVGISTALIALSPLVCAVLTSASLVAASIAALAF